MRRCTEINIKKREKGQPIVHAVQQQIADFTFKILEQTFAKIQEKDNFRQMKKGIHWKDDNVKLYWNKIIDANVFQNPEAVANAARLTTINNNVKDHEKEYAKAYVTAIAHNTTISNL